MDPVNTLLQHLLSMDSSIVHRGNGPQLPPPCQPADSQPWDLGFRKIRFTSLILRKLCLSSPGPSNRKVKGNEELAGAQERQSHPHSPEPSYVTLGALHRGPPLTPGKPLILTLAKHAIKHTLPPSNRLVPMAGRGALTKAPFSPGKAVLIRPPRERHNRVSVQETKAVTASDPSSRCRRDSWSILAQKDSRNAESNHLIL